MCDEENMQTLQRGMNFRLGRTYSVVLMSQRTNAPYVDSIQADGRILEYEGHDAPRTDETPNPKAIDQPRITKTGQLTQNGLFANAVDVFKNVQAPAEMIKVYEKVFPGIWTFRGMFDLIDYRIMRSDGRCVYRFILQLSTNQGESDASSVLPVQRAIPSEIKQTVWKRDHGCCKICGAVDNLHFDHIIPYSKGGTSLSAENVQILCARHNLQKSDKIE